MSILKEFLSLFKRNKQKIEQAARQDAWESLVEIIEQDRLYFTSQVEEANTIAENLRAQLDEYKVYAEAKLESTRKLLRLHENELKRIRPIVEAAVAFIDKKKESPSFLALRKEGKPLPELVRKLQMFDSEEAANLIEAVEEMQNAGSSQEL